MAGQLPLVRHSGPVEVARVRLNVLMFGLGLAPTPPPPGAALCARTGGPLPRGGLAAPARVSRACHEDVGDPGRAPAVTAAPTAALRPLGNLEDT